MKRLSVEQKQRNNEKRQRTLANSGERREYLETQWCTEKNEGLYGLACYGNYSTQKATWICSKSTCEHPHIWDATICDRMRGTECPYCSNKKVCPCDSLPVKHPEVVALWDYSQNGSTRPEDYGSTSTKKVYFWCKKSGCDHHRWRSKICRVVRNGCLFCNPGRGNEFVCPCTSIVTTHPELAKQWHPTKNKKLKPEQFRSTSCEYIWWKCLEHKTCDKHEWPTTINHRLVTGCPFCEHRRGRPCPCYNFATRAPPELLQEWHPDNKSATEYMPTSKEIVKWKCTKHEEHPSWTAKIGRRMSGVLNCPVCYETQSYGESKTRDALHKLVRTEFISHNRKTPPGMPLLKDKWKLRFDFILLPEPGKRERFCAVEFDGAQHFNKASNWFADATSHDRIKNLYAAKHKVHLLRIGYSVKHNFESVVSSFLDRVRVASPGETIIYLEGPEYTQEYRRRMFIET